MKKGRGENWERCTLEELLKRGWVKSHLDGNHGGNYPRKNEFIDSGIPYISANCIKGNHVDFAIAKYLSHQRAALLRKGIAHNNDVLFAHNATVGPVALLQTKEDKVILGTSLTYYRCDEDYILAKYLAIYMQSPEFTNQYKQVMQQSTRNQVPITKQRTFTHIIPPLPEQKRIVAILDEAFAGIDQAIGNTERNLENARELFDSYLSDVFTQKSEGWEQKPLQDLTERITKGSSPKWQGINYVDKPGVLFVTSENVGNNKMIYCKTKYVEAKFNEKDSKSILVKGDVLTNIVGASIGRTAIYDRDEVANINQAVCLIRCYNDKLINEYLSYLLNSPVLKQILHDNEINNARANLSLGFFRSLKVLLPNLVEQRRVIDKLDILSAQVQHLESIYRQKLTALSELKQSILQKAFTGELTEDTVQ